MKIKSFVRVLLSLIISASFTSQVFARTKKQEFRQLKEFKDDRTTTERTTYGLKYMIRKRSPGENWYDYFCNVLLSLGKERGRLDFGFQSFQKDKVKFEFIPFTVFDVEGIGLIVPVKTASIEEAMKEIHLRQRPGREEVFDLTPVSFVQSKCDEEDIYFLIYKKPQMDIYQLNIDFPRFKAGCVAVIRNEDSVRNYYRPAYSFTEIARDISIDTRTNKEIAAEEAKKQKYLNTVHKIKKIMIQPQEAGLRFTIELKPGAQDGSYDIKTEFLEGEEIYDTKAKLFKGQSEFQYSVPYERIPKLVSLSASAKKRGFAEKFVAWVRISRELDESGKDLKIYDSALSSADTAQFSIDK
jgi:hypothetical protein